VGARRPLRPRLLGHLVPLVQDVVIASEAGASSRSWCSRILGPRRRRSGSAWPASRAPAAPIASSAHILTEPPSLDAGEITDKGTINQRAVLARRRDLVDQLYCGPTASLFNA
jgi:feruloyl-CoA synthase